MAKIDRQRRIIRDVTVATLELSRQSGEDNTPAVLPPKSLKQEGTMGSISAASALVRSPRHAITAAAAAIENESALTVAKNMLADWKVGNSRQLQKQNMFGAAMEPFRRARMYKEVIEVMEFARRSNELMGKKVFITKRMCSLTVDAMIQLEQEEQVDRLFLEAETYFGRECEKRSIHKEILRLVADANRADLTRRLVSLTPDNILRQSPTLFTVLMRCFAQASCLDDCYELYTRMKELGIPLTTRTACMMMKAHHRKRDIEGMNAVLKMVKDDQVEPTMNLYAMLMAAYMNAGDDATALKMYEQGKTRSEPYVRVRRQLYNL